MRFGKGVHVFLLAATLLAQCGCSRLGGDRRREGGDAGGGQGQGQGQARPAPHFRTGFNLFTPEQDIKLGRESAQQVESEVRLLNDPAVSEYLRALGTKLSALAPGHDFPYQFRVVAAEEVNAFALPGGFIFVNAGAVTAARNEGELAGVLAHEIAHVALRHGTNQASKAYIAQAGLSVLGRIVGVGSTEAGQIINAVGGVGANMLFLRFSRTAETEADVQGAAIMASAGYDPRDMASFFETIKRLGAGDVPEMLNDHPDPGDRAAKISRLLPSLQVAADPVRDTAEFQQIRARLQRMTLGGAAGLVRTGPVDPGGAARPARPPLPSGTYREFGSPDGAYALDYPENWRALRSEDGNMIFAPPGGYGEQRGAVYLTHGVFVGVIDPPAADLREANTIFVRSQTEANPDFHVQGSIRSVTFADGRSGYATTVAGPSTVTGVVEIDVIYTTATDDGRLFYIITVAPEDEYDAYHPAFDRVIGRLRFGG